MRIRGGGRERRGMGVMVSWRLGFEAGMGIRNEGFNEWYVRNCCCFIFLFFLFLFCVCICFCVAIPAEIEADIDRYRNY